ncbi:hypothetical protein [Ruegeria faecimaris]|uniref:hypothetical protein n=1 Tax=Ruegeria faecimaris TaxID=686389 RepID=UPI002491A6DE|nr:hypothetical protein [Ruegeria faecimaris]
MSSLKTFLVLLLILPKQSPAADDPLMSSFAACAGRFSAELEHAWLMNDDRTDQIAHRRAQFIDLLNTTVPDDQRRHALHLRIDAKMAHAKLLSAARFSHDADRSKWAVRRARAEIDYCTGFLLES